MGDLVSSLLAFTTTFALLFIYSAFDIRVRKVPNQIMLVGGVIGVVVNVMSGHFCDNLLLHLFALVFALSISYVLFQLGTFGGADAKALISVAIISPGFEFIIWLNPLTEAIIATGIEVVVMLSLGHFWWYQAKIHNKETPSPPLIPLLLIGYTIIASFATVVTFL